MIHDEIVTFEVAKLAKEKGFDWHPPMYFHSGVKNDLREVGRYGANPNNIPYSPHISCPTQTQLQRWLREEKGLHITVPFDNDGFWWQIKNLANGDSEYGEALGFNTYELALEDALAYSLKNLV